MCICVFMNVYIHRICNKYRENLDMSFFFFFLVLTNYI